MVFLFFSSGGHFAQQSETNIEILHINFYVLSTNAIVSQFDMGYLLLMTIISEKGVRYQITIDSSETDSISYNYVVENEYSIIKQSGKVALQSVPRSTCVSVQFSPYKIHQGTLQS